MIHHNFSVFLFDAILGLDFLGLALSRRQVSSSNFPRFDRNLNTGRDAATDDSPVAAAQQVFHATGRRSVLTLPVVPPAPPTGRL